MKNSSWQAKQSIPHTAVMFYSDCENVLQSLPWTLAAEELGVASWQCTISHVLLHQGISDWNNMTIVSHLPCLSDFPPYNFSLFPTILTQLRCSRQNCRQCWTPSQSNFQDAFRNGRSTENGAYVQKGATLRVMVAIRSRVSFWSHGSTSPKIVGNGGIHNSTLRNKQFCYLRSAPFKKGENSHFHWSQLSTQMHALSLAHPRTHKHTHSLSLDFISHTHRTLTLKWNLLACYGCEQSLHLYQVPKLQGCQVRRFSPTILVLLM
jgi:hypothetical protein